MTENELAKQIVDAAYRVHTTLGPGLLESVYGQQPVPLVYYGWCTTASTLKWDFGRT